MLDLIIDNTVIRTDDNGYFCVNDLHKAAGNSNSDRPKYWLQTKQAKELILLINTIGGKPPILVKQGLGTFVAKQLVYSYAMWLSSEFALHVIDTFDAIVTQQTETLRITNEDLLKIKADYDVVKISPLCAKSIMKERDNKGLKDVAIIAERFGMVEFYDETIVIHRQRATPFGTEIGLTMDRYTVHYPTAIHDILRNEVKAERWARQYCKQTELSDI
jgi:hypothetical protein